MASGSVGIVLRTATKVVRRLGSGSAPGPCRTTNRSPADRFNDQRGIMSHARMANAESHSFLNTHTDSCAAARRLDASSLGIRTNRKGGRHITKVSKAVTFLGNVPEQLGRVARKEVRDGRYCQTRCDETKSATRNERK